MAQVSEKDITAIKDWLAQEPTLPKDFEDIMIKKFLFSCHCSLERTKRCIEHFCNNRATMTEVFSNRDPLSTGMKNAFNATAVSTYLIEDKEEIMIHRLLSTDNFDFYNNLKSFSLQSDHWLRQKKDVLPEHHIVVLDIKEYTLMIVARSNVFYFQKFLTFLLEAMPVRLKEVHVVNCPSFYEYLYGLVKGALPQEIRDIIHFHTDHMGLHKFVDKKYLPAEYDGDAESMVEQSNYWVTEINDQRKFYLNNDLWKADLNKKIKNSNNNPVETTMSGSFRTLAID
ncbi:alpha-tocopherol transfer protein-like [Helicoverpa zea]|uniref:alpha-tocopherol transfer protein-like n=1 Tax=Helicoverpa zea TaxID=7113 RepID=UPI001F5690D1|nr:alpha-tocopherol transfer protein-like [Helicoverpa zea]